MSWRHEVFRGTCLGLLAVVPMTFGCTVDRTEIMVVVDTDFAVPGGLSSIKVEATGPSGATQVSQVDGLSAAKLPATVGLVHTDGPLGPFLVRASGLLGATEVIDREARVSFVEHHTLVLELPLLEGCAGVGCGQDQTCGEHGCRPVDVAQGEMPEWSGTPPRLDGGADGDADADADFDAPDTGCGDFDFRVTPGAPPDLVIVVDASTSMQEDMEAGTSKWEALRDAVDAVTTSLEGSVHFGLAVYPAGGMEDMCAPGEVEIAPAPNAADQIMEALGRAHPGGATPTSETLQAVGDYLATARAGHELDPPAILLATDGAPNCNSELDPDSCPCTIGGDNCRQSQYCLDDARTYATIEAIAGGARPVPVYVVGLPGSEQYADVLSEMARRGGTARPGAPAYYAPGDSGALESALVEITSQLVTCTFETDVAPEDPRRVRVLLDGAEVPHDDAVPPTNGWSFTNPANTQIELFGAWCDQLSDGGAHTLTASYECTTVW